MKFSRTNRGFLIAQFRDHYKVECSLQESSLAIWLGVNESANGQGRMHLTRKQVATLLPHLERFVKTGSLDE